MLLESIIEARGRVTFPEFTGERAYMVPFLKAEGLPDALARWQPTVDAMLDGIDTDQQIYIMIDQGVVKAGTEHRRPGLHVDGYWNPGTMRHGHSGVSAHGGSPMVAPAHRGAPLRHQGIPSMPPGHRGVPMRHAPIQPRHTGQASSWAEADFTSPEGIILASSVSAARGFVGTFDGPVGEMGDCGHVDVARLVELPMVSHTVYAGNVCCLHESLPVDFDCERTLVRLNAPGWTPAR